jgi:hypothetical protein
MASGRRIRYHREQIAKSHPSMEPPGRTHRVSRIAANNTRESVESPTDFPAGVRADVYEFYWADLTAGATWESLKAWVGGLLFRPLSRSKRCPPGVGSIVGWLRRSRRVRSSRGASFEFLAVCRAPSSRQLAMASRCLISADHRRGASDGYVNIRARRAVHACGPGQHSRPRRGARPRAQASAGAARHSKSQRPPCTCYSTAQRWRLCERALQLHPNWALRKIVRRTAATESALGALSEKPETTIKRVIREELAADA